MTNWISHQRVTRFGTIGLLLLVQIWVVHHLAAEHHDQGFDHHHMHGDGSEQREITHTHGSDDTQDTHHSHDHELSLFRFEKLATCTLQSVAICSDIQIFLPEPALFNWPSPGDGSWLKIESNPRCQPRAPPSLFVV